MKKITFMETVITYFSTIPSVHRSIILASGIAFFWLLEEVNPSQKMYYSKWRHAGINLFFTMTTIIVNFCLAFVLLQVSAWTTTNNFGLLQFLPSINFWVFTTVGLLLMDFIGAYLPHYVQHNLKFLWRFHLVHHTDTFVDTTTANRHHPTESVIRFLFTALAVLIIGAPMWLVFLYQTLSIIATQFTHANIGLPRKIDKILSYILVSPDMHKVHHHYVLPFTDSNYGNIFSVWDRIFGTFKRLDRTKVVFGVDTYQLSSENNALGNLLKIPFQKARFSDEMQSKKNSK